MIETLSYNFLLKVIDLIDIDYDSRSPIDRLFSPEKIREAAGHILKQCRLILLSQSALDQSRQLPDYMVGVDDITNVRVPFPPPMPFPTIWIETDNDYYLFDVSKEAAEALGYERIADHHVSGFLLHFPDQRLWEQLINSDLEQFVGRKILPSLTIMTLFAPRIEDLRNGRKKHFLMIESVDRETCNRHGYYLWIFNLLNNFGRSYSIGSEKVNYRARTGSGAGRELHQIKNIVRVTSKKDQPNFKKQNRNVVWSHQWEVRGHWRAHEGVGKDVFGDYNVKGFTWVSPYIKGSGDLIKKARVVPDAN